MTRTTYVVGFKHVDGSFSYLGETYTPEVYQNAKVLYDLNTAKEFDAKARIERSRRHLNIGFKIYKLVHEEVENIEEVTAGQRIITV